MEYRELGSTGERVSAIGVGCWAAGGSQWGGTDDTKTSEAFHRAIDLGINFFDTAPVYGYGHSELVLGQALEGAREKVFLATKFGLAWEAETLESIHNNLRPGAIRAECEASLKRLRTDRIDLYQCHWPLQGDGMTRTVCEDMVGALIDLRQAGMVRFFGVSNFTIDQIELCGGGDEIASLQPPLSILRPGAADELIPYCLDQRIGVVCYSPLFRGLLTGKYRGDETFPEGDSRGEHPDYSGENFRGICERVQRLEPYAESHEATIAAVSLNWVLSTPGVTVALAGTRSADQIEKASAGQGWNLTPEECCKISGLFEGFAKVP